MIVKMQISLTKPARVLIYNRDRSVMHEEGASQGAVDVMNGDKRAFFEADVTNGVLTIGKRVPDEDW